MLFSITFGFFSSSYSATWGGFLNELEHGAAQWNEVIDLGMLYGLLNGARGVGYAVGGFAGVSLLKAGSVSAGKFAYGTTFRALIRYIHGAYVSIGWMGIAVEVGEVAASRI